jgi:uncharacterized membrane protein YkvA (DUF1232 family)
MVRGVLIGLAVAAAVWLLAVGLLYLFGRRVAAKELATLLPHLIGLFRGLVRDPRVPRRTKAWLFVGVAWLVSPIDLIPEFIPLLGPLDDAVVAALILRHVLRVASSDVVADHWRGSPKALRWLLGRRFLARDSALVEQPGDGVLVDGASLGDRELEEIVEDHPGAARLAEPGERNVERPGEVLEFRGPLGGDADDRPAG